MTDSMVSADVLYYLLETVTPRGSVPPFIKILGLNVLNQLIKLPENPPMIWSGNWRREEREEKVEWRMSFLAEALPPLLSFLLSAQDAYLDIMNSLNSCGDCQLQCHKDSPIHCMPNMILLIWIVRGEAEKEICHSESYKVQPWTNKVDRKKDSESVSLTSLKDSTCREHANRERVTFTASSHEFLISLSPRCGSLFTH